MRLGLVRYSNAHPLTWGIRKRARKDSSIRIFDEVPSRLAQMLKAGALDAALISSVEAIRNEESLAYCKTVGVCAKNEVRSILYIRKKESQDKNDSYELWSKKPTMVYADQGSRSSTALLQILLNKHFNETIPVKESPPDDIPYLLSSQNGGLLIGDAALAFHQSPLKGYFETKDLASWWNEITGLPFVFAVWSYPKDHPLPDSFFEESLNEGLNSIEDIIDASGFEDSETYFKDLLHYRIGEEERSALELYRSLLSEQRLL